MINRSKTLCYWCYLKEKLLQVIKCSTQRFYHVQRPVITPCFAKNNVVKDYTVISVFSVWISYKVPVLSLLTAKSKEQLLTPPATHEAYD